MQLSVRKYYIQFTRKQSFKVYYFSNKHSFKSTLKCASKVQLCNCFLIYVYKITSTFVWTYTVHFFACSFSLSIGIFPLRPVSAVGACRLRQRIPKLHEEAYAQTVCTVGCSCAETRGASARSVQRAEEGELSHTV